MGYGLGPGLRLRLQRAVEQALDLRDRRRRLLAQRPRLLDRQRRVQQARRRDADRRQLLFRGDRRAGHSLLARAQSAPQDQQQHRRRGARASAPNGCARSTAPTTSRKMRDTLARGADDEGRAGRRSSSPRRNACSTNSGACGRCSPRRSKPGERVVREKFGVDDDICTGDHACIRLSGCPSLSVKHTDDPLKDDPIAAIDENCVGCGNCGEVAEAAVLCPSFYRAEIIHNPSDLGPLARTAARRGHRLVRGAARRAAACAFAGEPRERGMRRPRSPGRRRRISHRDSRDGRPGRRRARRLDRRARGGARAGPRNRPRCPASRSAPARRSITSRWRRREDDAQPVFALMPTPGDVDVVMAAELMEAGRSVLRGLVTPDRTTLIASTHRALRGGRRSRRRATASPIPSVVSIATDFAARRVIAFDMEAHGEGERQRDLGGDVRRARGGRGAAVSARGLRGADPRAAARASRPACAPSPPPSTQTQRKPLEPVAACAREALRRAGRRATGNPNWIGSARASDDVSRAGAQPMFAAGVAQLVDYLDPAYAARISRSPRRACRARPRARRRGEEASPSPRPRRNISRWRWPMTTSPRVADLKIRASRQARVRARGRRGRRYDRERRPNIFIRASEEFCGALPQGSGDWIESQAGRRVRRCDKVVNRGRRIRPNTIDGLSDARRSSRSLGAERRGSLRHARETAHREAWLAGRGWRRWRADYDLGVEALALPAAGQGLFRHPCARPVEIRSRDGRRAGAGGARGWRRLARPPEARRARRTKRARRWTAC